jgi:microcompartment protein CcmL/EutN
MIEWDSIAVGLKAADAAIKAAPVAPLTLRAITPGRYVAAFLGDVESISAAVARGVEVGGASTIDSLVLPKPHVGLRGASGARTGETRLSAVGVVETLTCCASLGAADLAAKEAEVRLHEIRLATGLGGKAYVVLSGEVAQVEAAVARGAAFAKGRGALPAVSVIPNPDALLLSALRVPGTPFQDFIL